MTTEEPLLKFEYGQQKTLPISHNKDNFIKFMKALEIWTSKPQVVDRRVLCSTRLLCHVSQVDTGLTLAELLEQIRSKVKHFLKDYIDGNNLDLDRYVNDRPKSSGVIKVEENAGILETRPIDKFGSHVIELQLYKILPRQSDRMEPFYQVVLIDNYRCEAFFIRLDSNTDCPSLPEDIDQSWSYKVSCDVRSQKISITTSQYYELQHPVKALPELTPPTKEWLFSTLITKLVKWTNEINPEIPLHVNKSVISMERYSRVHAAIKMKYAEKFVKNWPESTDPQKFVYEDISIAAYLIVLWEEERRTKQLEKKQSFVDLGCGNGLLVHILNSEGHPGKGIDLRKRKIWDLYGPATILEENAIIPGQTKLTEEYDWLIGNHSDELTPWIPVMAFRSSLNTRYFVLPCCFHDFDRKYNKTDSNTSQYRSYLNFIQEVGEICGYKVEEDNLRIPSTKRICQIGMEVPSVESRQITNDHITLYIQTRCDTSNLQSHICNSLEDYVSLATKNIDETLSSVGSLKWSVNFEPRQKEETVRNCSNLNKDLKERIVTEVFSALMLDENKCEVIVQETKRQKKWSKGGSITITDAVNLFERDTLKQLKRECGGLKTLLKNHYQIFHVVGNDVRVRDWSDLDASSSKGSSKNKYKDSARREEKYKTKLCWFHSNHPDGCPRRKTDCPFAHGSDDVKASILETKRFKEIVLKIEEADIMSKQLLTGVADEKRTVHLPTALMT